MKYVVKHARNVRKKSIDPWLILLHATNAKASGKAVAKWLARDGGANIFAHLIIDRDGTVYESAPITTLAYHCRGRIGGDPVNNVAIGIELANSQLKSGTWEPFTCAQMDSLDEVVAGIKQSLPKVTNWSTHSRLDPSRKVDPGPMFDEERFSRASGLIL